MFLYSPWMQIYIRYDYKNTEMNNKIFQLKLNLDNNDNQIKKI